VQNIVSCFDLMICWESLHSYQSKGNLIFGVLTETFYIKRAHLNNLKNVRELIVHQQFCSVARASKNTKMAAIQLEAGDDELLDMLDSPSATNGGRTGQTAAEMLTNGSNDVNLKSVTANPFNFNVAESSSMVFENTVVQFGSKIVMNTPISSHSNGGAPFLTVGTWFDSS